MSCKKIDSFDKENPNYQLLVDYIEKGRIKLIEDECKALIFSKEFEGFNILGLMKHLGGMHNYLDKNGYSVEFI